METKDLKRMLEAVAPGAAKRKEWDFGQTIGREGDQESTTDHGDAPDSPKSGRVSVGAVLESGTSYEIKEEIGRGGMGLVYRGSQSEIGRPVAIKALKPSRVTQAGCRDSFFSEARILGMLEHPNIVPMHDLLILKDGEVAIAMREVSGTSWLQLLHPVTPEQQARADGYALEDHLDILITVCNAIAYAHSRGVIHRDLKPSNVMVGEFGEVLVMDWGMAVTFEDDCVGVEGLHPRAAKSVTMPGGSPGYMAPEMAMAKGDYLGPRTDVYLLGSILYEVLVGEMPHQGSSLYKVVKAAFKSEPKDFPASVPDELQQICRKAMARRLADRYRTVEEFQHALRDFLRHRESHAMVAASDNKLEEVAAQSQQVLRRDSSRNAVYESLAEALAGYRQAKVLWSGNAEAAAGEYRARLMFARKAYESEDFGLARSHLEGLEGDPEAHQLTREIDGQLQVRAAREQNNKRMRAAGIAAAALLVIGLSVGVVVVAMEKARADGNAGEAARLASEAQANLARAQELELAARRAADEAQASARLAEQEARAKARALELITAEKARADANEAKAQRMAEQALHNAREAERREEDTKVALEKARVAERRANAAAKTARAESQRRAAALGEVQRLADFVLLRRVEERGRGILGAPSIDARTRDGWLADARDLAERLPSHRQALVKLQLRASKGRNGIGTDLRQLEDLLGQVERRRSALGVVSLSGTQVRAARAEIARLEKDVQRLQVKAAAFAGYRFAGERNRFSYEALRDLVAGLEALAAPGGLMDRVRGVGRGN